MLLHSRTGGHGRLLGRLLGYFRIGCGGRGVLRQAFFEYRGEETPSAGGAADMDILRAVVHETQVAFPAEIVQNKPQALHFLWWQASIFDIENLPGSVSRPFDLIGLAEAL